MYDLYDYIRNTLKYYVYTYRCTSAGLLYFYKTNIQEAKNINEFLPRYSTLPARRQFGYKRDFVFPPVNIIMNTLYAPRLIEMYCEKIDRINSL